MMKVQQFPDIDLPTITVTASLPGAAPAQLETEVARKIDMTHRNDRKGLSKQDVEGQLREALTVPPGARVNMGLGASSE